MCCRHAQLCLILILIYHNNNSNSKKPHQHTFNYFFLKKPGFEALLPDRKWTMHLKKKVPFHSHIPKSNPGAVLITQSLDYQQAFFNTTFIQWLLFHVIESIHCFVSTSKKLKGRKGALTPASGKFPWQHPCWFQVNEIQGLRARFSRKQSKIIYFLLCITNDF